MQSIKKTLRYYKKCSFLSMYEEHSSLSSTFAGLLLYPCFIWIFSKLWLGLNNYQSSLGEIGLFVYIGLSEILFLNSLREPALDRANSDFSLSFVRPRSWSISIGVSIFSRTLYKRLVYLILYFIFMPIFISDFNLVSISGLRFICLLPLLTVVDSLYSFILTCIQIRFHTAKNFRMLFGKLFLIFGGVLAPLSDLSTSWKNILINTPFSDLIFQPCYFSLTGTFYRLTFSEWFVRIIVQLSILVCIAYFVYKNSRKYYHNFGG